MRGKGRGNNLHFKKEKRTGSPDFEGRGGDFTQEGPVTAPKKEGSIRRRSQLRKRKALFPHPQEREGSSGVSRWKKRGITDDRKKTRDQKKTRGHREEPANFKFGKKEGPAVLVRIREVHLRRARNDRFRGRKHALIYKRRLTFTYRKKTLLEEERRRLLLDKSQKKEEKSDDVLSREKFFFLKKTPCR